MEVSYRKHLYLPAAMEVHPVNDQAHGKMEQWAPDSEKMLAELEGNRMSKSLNVSPAVGGLPLASARARPCSADFFAKPGTLCALCHSCCRAQTARQRTAVRCWPEAQHMLLLPLASLRCQS